MDGGRLISLDLETPKDPDTQEIKDLRIVGYKETIVDYYFLVFTFVIDIYLAFIISYIR